MYTYRSTLDILFSSNHNIHKKSFSLCFLASDPLIDRFYLKFKSKGHKNFYEFCDLTEKVYLVLIYVTYMYYSRKRGLEQNGSVRVTETMWLESISTHTYVGCTKLDDVL